MSDDSTSRHESFIMKYLLSQLTDETGSSRYVELWHILQLMNSISWQLLPGASQGNTSFTVKHKLLSSFLDGIRSPSLFFSPRCYYSPFKIIFSSNIILELRYGPNMNKQLGLLEVSCLSEACFRSLNRQPQQWPAHHLCCWKLIRAISTRSTNHSQSVTN